jgi:hypothetical protein
MQSDSLLWCLMADEKGTVKWPEPSDAKKRLHGLNAERLLLFLLAIFLATNFFSGPYKRNDHPDHQTAESEIHQTSTVAPVKRQGPAVQEQQAAERADQESAPMEKYEFWSLILTAFIVYITAKYTQAAYLQLEKLNESVGAATRSASVAERALTELEVPYVSIGEIVPHVLLQREGQVGPSPNAVIWFEFGFRNSGRALAEVTSVHAELRIVGVLAVPPEYSGTIEESAFPIGPNSDTGKIRWNAIYKFPLGKIDDEFSSLMTSKARLVCFGYVRYRDAFKTKWITGFGWQWNPYNNGAYLIGGRYYNYCRKEE